MITQTISGLEGMGHSSGKYSTVREIIEQFLENIEQFSLGNYRRVVKNFHSRLGVSGRGRIVEQPAFRNEIRIERHVFVVFHLVRAAASTTNQLKYRLRGTLTSTYVQDYFCAL